MQIEISEKTARIAIHAMTLVMRTGGGSPIHSALRELQSELPTEIEVDMSLLSGMLGNVITEAMEVLPLEDGAGFRELGLLAGADFRHPYDVG